MLSKICYQQNDVESCIKKNELAFFDNMKVRESKSC